MNPQEELFLIESNLIEGVGEEGLGDSIKAYLYLMQVKPPLNLKHILKVHRLLMQNLNPRIAGKLREVPVGIYSGGSLVRSCPLPLHIPELMSNFLENINNKRNLTIYPEEKPRHCEENHIEFEYMHPFEDGNGRVGRIIWAWNRKQMSLPLLIVYNKQKQEYYKLFN
jgi:Fic family protein